MFDPAAVKRDLMLYSAGGNLFDFPERRGRGNAAAVGMILAPILIGGALAVVAFAGRSRLGLWLRGFLSAGDAAGLDGLRQRLSREGMTRPMLREWMVGRTKAQIAARFGPPRTAALLVARNGSAGQAAFWRAETWYYAFEDTARAALAVKFAGDVARDVDFIDSPAVEAAADESTAGESTTGL